MQPKRYATLLSLLLPLTVLAQTLLNPLTQKQFVTPLPIPR